MKHNGIIGLTVVDGWFILLSLALIFGINPMPEPVTCRALIYFEPFLMAYCIFHILFVLNYKWASYLLLSLLSVYCVYELILGYIQFLQDFGKSKGQDIIVGSFSGSGPFGCLLSLFTCICVAVYVRSQILIIRISSVFFAILSFILMACTLSRASMVSFSVSMLFLMMKSEKAVSFVRRNRVYILLVSMAVGAGAYLVKKPSADGRILMAKVGLKIMKENGLAGVGNGNYAGTYGKAQAAFFSDYFSEDLTEIKGIPERLRMTADCPAFCFNEYLKTGIESGPIAMLLLLLLVTGGIMRTYRMGSVWCYPLISISVFACFSYPFEVGVLTLIMTVCLSADNGNTGKKGKVVLFYSVMLAVFASIFYQHHTAIRSSYPVSGLTPLERLCSSRSKRYIIYGNDVLQDGLYDEKTLFALGQSLNRNGEYERSDKILKLGSEISSDPMFWNVMGNNSMAQRKFREAESRYEFAFRMVPNRLYPLYLMAKLYHEEGDTARFLKMADMVETFVPKVESVNTEKMRSEIRALKSSY